ncbi:hypothetical protein Adt_23123 [Abeliophyllum distichum]|uniref:Uncharacterized protein n=1 Tax=Abeliophyllum distichum TaxID=126358 RepID=A0ABD1SCR4_9LAMI
MSSGTQNVLLIISRSALFTTERTSIATHLLLIDRPSPVEPPTDGTPIGSPPLIGIITNSSLVSASMPQSSLTLAADGETSGELLTTVSTDCLESRRYLPE